MKRLLSAVMACTLLLAGCGAKKEREVSPNTGKEYFKVGMSGDLSPFAYLTQAQSDTTVVVGEEYYDGYDIRIARKLADTMGMEIQVKKIAEADMQKALNDGDIDVIISAQYLDAGQDVDTTSSYLTSDVVLIVRKEDDLSKSKELSSFKDKKVAAVKGTSLDTLIDEIEGVRHEAALTSYDELVKALQDKKLDAICVPSTIAKGIVKQPSDLATVALEEGKGFSKKVDAMIAMKKGSKEDELFEKIQSALNGITQEERDEMLKAVGGA